MGKFSTEVQLSREMSVFDVTLIGVGAMVAAGVAPTRQTQRNAAPACWLALLAYGSLGRGPPLQVQVCCRESFPPKTGIRP